MTNAKVRMSLREREREREREPHFNKEWFISRSSNTVKINKEVKNIEKRDRNSMCICSIKTNA